MSIPKKIHYCWFGGKPLPKSAVKCIDSWKKHCPDYEIIEWNESNFDIKCNDFCRTMSEQKKWAFLTDYVRLKIIYENGGVYLDTDVQVIKSLDPLMKNGAYMGEENTGLVATGLGFAAEAGHPLIKKTMAYYEELKDFSDVHSCPWITTEILEVYGYKKGEQIIQQLPGLTIYPEEYLCPKNERTGLTRVTKNTYSIHHFDASWYEDSWKRGQRKRWREERIRYILHIPNRALMTLLGSERYNKIKRMIKR